MPQGGSADRVAFQRSRPDTSQGEHEGGAYRSAGVDREAAQDARDRIGAVASTTYGPEVLAGIGGFGAMYRLSGYSDPVLVSSTDGVGTKIKIAVALERYEDLGVDVVNACANDVIVTGARPLYFLDYLAMGKLVPETVEAIGRGMARACGETGCALIGGETAEMPGMYGDSDFDLAGFAVGAVEGGAVLEASAVREGDLLLGVPSSGLHTNGYSLVRHSLGLDQDSSPLLEYHPELGRTLGEELLEPHRAYYPLVAPVQGLVKAMAHITGGGLIENVPRALPPDLGCRLDTAAWLLPPIFSFLQERSHVSSEEMYRVFNMGLGLVMVCDTSRAAEVTSLVPEAMVVGEVVASRGDHRVLL